MRHARAARAGRPAPADRRAGARDLPALVPDYRVWAGCLMPLPPLTAADVARVAAAYGLFVTDQDVASFRALADGLLASYEVVERRHAASLLDPPVRDWRRPEEAMNPLGAWYVTTDIHARDDGPLAGRRIAVKDNIAVAGVPMMNGSAVLEGFVPRRDATVVTRLLDAGAVITG